MESPKTLFEFQDRFPDEEACWRHLRPDVGPAPLARLLVDRTRTYRTLRKRRLKFLSTDGFGFSTGVTHPDCPNWQDGDTNGNGTLEVCEFLPDCDGDGEVEGPADF